MAKAWIGHVLTPEIVAGLRLGYNRPLTNSELAEARRHVAGIANPFGRGEFTARFANVTGINGVAVGVDTNSFTTDKKLPLGTIAVGSDGRIWRYGSVGAADTVAGSIYQSAAPIANHLANTPPAVAVGATSFTYTPGATAGAANLYEDGYLGVDTTPGNGYTYRVSGHAAISSSTAFTLNLFPDDPIQIALTTSSRVGLIHNPYKNVIVAATTVTAPVAGGASGVITAANYGWLQTRGTFSALINGTPAVGTGLVTSATTAGALDVAAVAAEINVRIVARAKQVGVSTKNNFVFLLLD